jgi:hypothetical protein
MDADDEHQRLKWLRELESTFWGARRDRIKLPMIRLLAAISGH